MDSIAALAAQHVGAKEDSRVAIEMPAGHTRDAVHSELERLGALPLTADESADAGVAYHQGDVGDLAPVALQTLMGRVAPGGRAALIVKGRSADAEAGALWGLLHPRYEALGDHAVVSGALPESVKSSTRRRLRGLGHAMEASIQVGRQGLTDEVLLAIQGALRRHGLVKVKLTPQCSLDKVEAARQMAYATGSQIIQRVGKTALLYRRDVRLEPPASRGGRRRT